MDDLRTLAIQAIDDFLDHSGMSARALGVAAVGSEHFVKRLRVGTSIQLGTVDRALAWIGERSVREEDLHIGGRRDAR